MIIKCPQKSINLEHVLLKYNNSRLQTNREVINLWSVTVDGPIQSSLRIIGRNN